MPVVFEPDFQKGLALLHVKNDSAFYYFNQVVSHSDDSLQIAMAYNSMASIQSDEGDYFGSQENLLKSLHFLHEKRKEDSTCLSSDYNELGMTSSSLKNYAAAVDYYDRALAFATHDGAKLIYLNNKALAYQKIKEFAKAIIIFDSLLNKNDTNRRSYARVLSNRARTKWLQNSNYLAASELWTALQIRTEEQDLWGQNASYSHLSDYYARTRPDSALIYAHRMYNIAIRLNSPDDQLEALQKLILLDSPLNNQQYFARYQSLNDSLQTARNNSKNQFALIRYDAEKNKLENMQLQKENADKQLQIFQQRMMIYGGLTLAFFGLASSYFWFRKRKQKIIQEEKLKHSKKVHDVVAGDIYSLMTETEHNGMMEKDVLLDRLDDIYNKSRDISYEQSHKTKVPYHEEIAGLLGIFKSETIGVVTIGNNYELWEMSSDTTRSELKYIIRELMVNMKKHSAATTVIFNFEKTTNCINITYTDNGVGLASEIKQGNGLRNTVSRINAIGGVINFDMAVEKGTKVLISFPI